MKLKFSYYLLRLYENNHIFVPVKTHLARFFSRDGTFPEKGACPDILMQGHANQKGNVCVYLPYRNTSYSDISE